MTDQQATQTGTGALTPDQLHILKAFSPKPSLFKKNFPGTDWRRIDALTKRGLLHAEGYGAFHITDAGLAALRATTPATAPDLLAMSGDLQARTLRALDKMGWPEGSQQRQYALDFLNAVFETPPMEQAQ